MPNLGTVLKDEIRRLARREIKAAIAGLKRDNADLKRTVAQLKRRVKSLERDNRLLKAAEKRLREQTFRAKAGNEELESVRFTARGIRALRKKLGLSQDDFSRLLGVSPQAVYLWESKEGRLVLRDESKLALLDLRNIGAREARRRLEEVA